MPGPVNPGNPANKPDPAVLEASQRLKRVDLSPLEEQLFKGWMTANGMDETVDPDDHTGQIDYRDVYKQTKGEVLPHGQLQKRTQKQLDIQTMMQAQEAHEAASPIQSLMGGEFTPASGGGGGAPSPAMGPGSEPGY